LGLLMGIIEDVCGENRIAARSVSAKRNAILTVNSIPTPP